MRSSFLLSIVLLMQCTPQEVTRQELQAYVMDSDNGLHKYAELNGTKVEVSYLPTDLWVDQELDNHTACQAEIDSLRKKYSPHYYFILGLSHNNKEALHQAGGMAEYSDLVQTLSFRMAEYVTLTTAKQDTIPVADFMLNRTYGLSSSTDLLFVFNREKAKDEEWVQFNLNEFGLGVGNQRFRFSVEELEHTPKLKFNSID